MSILSLLLILLAIVCICAVAFWVVKNAGFPGPGGQIGVWIIAVIALIALIWLLLSVTGVNLNLSAPIHR